jgi:hypothetical protein
VRYGREELSGVRDGEAIRRRDRTGGGGKAGERGIYTDAAGDPGFIAYDWVDAGDGVMMSTSIYEDQAGAEASTAGAVDWVSENLASLLPNPPQVTAGEVVASA